MKNKQEILNNLAQFHGTDGYHKFNLFTKLVATDGVIYLAKEAGCFWLLDILVSVQSMPNIKKQEMQVLLFDLKDKVVRIEDGNKNVLYTQKISATDFPLNEIEIWVENGVVLLPSEH